MTAQETNTNGTGVRKWCPRCSRRLFLLGGEELKCITCGYEDYGFNPRQQRIRERVERLTPLARTEEGI